ncbi:MULTISPECIES: hypothetical protein [unclassified Streptomyces]|uniref:hypothetical protein n=1 Tax=unclassified Streptomyces TaxID=2593676 RepID=UPI000DAE047C|nr:MULTISPECIES: hypothetical protein [unclassified Streptomyces]PZT71946.1 hypothetical protein DNK55_25375 [Streptomyces sp. AC1-42T]
MPGIEHGTAPAPGPLPTRAGGSAPDRGLRRGPDLSRYASLAAYPPCQCGAAICPDAPPRPEPPEPEADAAGRVDGIRARVRETNAMRAKYRL